MDNKEVSEKVQRIIDRLENPSENTEPAQGVKKKDEEVRQQVEKAIDKAANEPDVKQG